MPHFFNFSVASFKLFVCYLVFLSYFLGFGLKFSKNTVTQRWDPFLLESSGLLKFSIKEGPGLTGSGKK